jgi:hypothetical protein
MGAISSESEPEHPIMKNRPIISIANDDRSLILFNLILIISPYLF